MERISSYRDLIVWQKSVDLVESVYELTRQFPKEELYGLTSQMRRAAVSIPSNIAEGKSRGTKKDYCLFMVYAFGSTSELETQVIIARRLRFADEKNLQKVEETLNELSKMLRSLIFRLKT